MDVGPKRDLVGRCCQSMGVVLSLVQVLAICLKQHVLFKCMLVYIHVYSWLSNLRLSENIIHRSRYIAQNYSFIYRNVVQSP